MSAAQLGYGALACWLALALVMALAWRQAIRTDNAGWIDVFWTFGIGLAGIVLALMSGVTPRATLAALLVAGWSWRLGSHILSRTRRNKDDPRYAQLRQDWGDQYPRRLFLFLQIQALAGVPLAIAVMIAAHRPGPLGVQDIAAIVLYLVAVFGEAASDRALHRFSQLPHRREAVCDLGLWGWSRHPNYFFEWLGWCVWPVMALSVGQGIHAYAWGMWSLPAPLLMYWLLVHVSGIPPLEAHMARSRGAAWQAYAARTPAFFPRRPRQPR